MRREVVLAAPGPLDQATGGYIYDRQIVDGLRRLGWDVRLTALSPRFPAPTAADVEATSAWLRALDPAVPVVIDGLAFGAMADVVAQVADRPPLIALVHHPLADETGLDPAVAEGLLDGEMLALRSAIGVVVTSPFTRRRLDAFGVAADRIRVVEPGVDRQSPAPCSGVPPRLLCVASYTRRKGHDVLLDALGRLADRPWQLLCVGATGLDPDHERAVRDRAARLGDRVTLLGPQPREQLGALYGHADLFVLASHYEGYGMVLSEALAAGVPVVACAGGAVRDTVPPDAGLLVGPGDAIGLADALALVMEDGNYHRSLVEGARNARLQLPSWDDAARRFAAAIRELAAWA
ncbi:MAG: glycosyltransferase family 4 protein [Pseudomonadota bacterium]